MSSDWIATESARVPFVIAEIGCNHGGQLEVAIDMVHVAARFAHVDAVKFQKREPRALLTQDEYDRPHPDPRHAFGPSYGLHREALEFSLADHKELVAAAESAGITYSSSVWDIPSARAIISLNPPFIKVPSACNLNKALLETLCEEYGGEIHISLGMTTRAEEDRIVSFLSDRARLPSVVLYHCTSGYPVPFQDLCLKEISRLVESYDTVVRGIGFSGHHLGIAADIAALSLGASFFERHFTLDRTSKGTDHAASLEPDGLRRLVRDIRNVNASLSYRPAGIMDIEVPQRRKLKTQVDL